MGLGPASSYLGSAAQNQAMLKAMRRLGYKKGLLKSSRDHYAMTQEDGLEIIARPGMGLLTPIGRGDSVFTSEQTKALWAISQNYVDALAKGFTAPNSGGNIRNLTNNNNLTISIDHVMDYEDFTRKIQQDNRFEQFIKACSTNQLNGANSVAKRRIRF